MLHELEEKGPSTLGIFRRGPNVRAMREIREQLDEFDPSAAPVDGESGVDIGNSCKQVNIEVTLALEGTHPLVVGWGQIKFLKDNSVPTVAISVFFYIDSSFVRIAFDKNVIFSAPI